MEFLSKTQVQKLEDPIRPSLEKLLELCERLKNQKPQDSQKIYSLHEPEVCCISKGKVRNRCEFGQKVLVASSNRKNWLVGGLLLAGNPYDGHTLSKSIQQVIDTTKVILAMAGSNFRKLLKLFLCAWFWGREFFGCFSFKTAGAVISM